MFPYVFLGKKNTISQRIKKYFDISVNLEYSDRNSIINYQEKNIERLLQTVVKNVPFYFKYLKSLKDYKQLGQKFAILPIIDKNVILNNFELMKAIRCSQNFQEINTSGTSDIKGRFLRTEECELKWLAHTIKVWAQNDVAIEKKHAFITNRLSENPKENISYFSNILKNCNHVALSIFWDLDKQIEWLKQEKPKYLTTFPTNLEHLYNKGYVPETKHIFTYGEPLDEEFQKIFESRTKIKITDFYNTTEAGIIAQQCEYGNHHINSDNYFVEILTDKKHKQAKIGKVIITVFSNQALPLIRYDIGDYVYINRDGICKCGKQSNYFNRIAGREINQLRSKIGKNSWAHKAVNYLRELENIEKFQIKQIEPSRINIDCVGKFRQNKKVERGLEKIIGSGIDIRIKWVKDIDREKSGKSSLIIRKF